jgi:hypothetical protein
MTKHSYKNHEIEVFTRDSGDFIEASAKFKPATAISGLLACGANSRASKQQSRPFYRKQRGLSITAANNYLAILAIRGCSHEIGIKFLANFNPECGGKTRLGGFSSLTPGLSFSYRFAQF